ncbi:MAG: hypothetical protein ACLUD0_05760 [Eubacterium ramulus]
MKRHMNVFALIAGEIYEQVARTGSYEAFIDAYISTYVHTADQKKIQEFLSYQELTNTIPHDCVEEDIHYRRKEDIDAESYVWMGKWL